MLSQHDLVITHGNGPQVGMLAVESAPDPALTHPFPFDVLDAQSQGMIGCWLVQALDGVAGKRAACLLCRTLVKADDPAFSQPTKFVGQVYDQATARRLAAEHGWQVRADGTAAWRRVVPSPEPAEILELDTIKLLSSCGMTVICAALLAEAVGADALLLLTDVEADRRGRHNHSGQLVWPRVTEVPAGQDMQP